MASELSRRKFLGAAGSAAAGAALASAAAEGAETRPLKVIAISCSPRAGKGTSTALEVCLDALREADPAIETELVELAGMRIPGEPAAGVALDEGERDDFPKLLPLLTDPKVAGIIFGTPVYFGNMSFLCKALLDRCIVLRKDFALGNKVAGVVAVGGGRNGGQELTIRAVQAALMSQQMVVVGDAPPTGHWGGIVWAGAGESVTDDEAGMNTVKNLARRVAGMVRQLHG